MVIARVLIAVTGVAASPWAAGLPVMLALYPVGVLWRWLRPRPATEEVPEVDPESVRRWLALVELVGVTAAVAYGDTVLGFGPSPIVQGLAVGMPAAVATWPFGDLPAFVRRGLVIALMPPCVVAAVTTVVVGLVVG